MSRLNKLQKFKEFGKFSNSTEYTDSVAKFELKKFIERNKVIVELACGRGEYATALAQFYPDKKFIAVDIQGERLWFGAKNAIEKNIENLVFFRSYIENLQDFLPEKSIDEIWITFPDPFPKDKHEKKRLTSERFLRLYSILLKPGGTIHLKTDSKELFDYSIGSVTNFGASVLEKEKDIYSKNDIPEELEIKTKFEKKWLSRGKKINYLKFTFS